MEGNVEWRDLAFRAAYTCCGVSLVLVSLALPCSAAKKSASWTIAIQPKRIVNGSPILIEVTPPQPLKSLSATWLGHDVFFSAETVGHAWYGLAGVPVEEHPGKSTLALHAVTNKGDTLSFDRPITIAKAKYKQIKITVPAKYTEPSPADLQQIAADKAVKAQVLSRIAPDREWSGNFAAPVKASISDVFGTARTFNGQTQSVHQGLDFGVPQGTPVMAVNRGTALLAQLLFFEGNCIVLDHGQGLLTIYMHLSKLEVKPGERVERGQQIGLSGGTGRATGPHLHLAARWQGVYIDPATLLALKMP
jgi:murein DD-endopeptidase MepM/ murein hydrolase activator NlpD